MYCTVLHCTVLYCTVLYCTALYSNRMHCAVRTLAASLSMGSSMASMSIAFSYDK